MTGHGRHGAPTELSGVVTAKQRAAVHAAARPTPPAPPHLAIGYGPAGATERRIGSAGATVSLGLGAAFGAIATRPDVIAFDTGRTVTHWWTVVSIAAFIGALVGLVLATRTARGPGSTTPMSLMSLLAAGAWIALLNTGRPEAVEALLAVAVALSVPYLFLAAADTTASRPWITPLAAWSGLTTGALAGFAAGAFVTFVDPDVPWATIAGVGGLVAAVGALRRLRLPERAFGTGPTSMRASAAPSPEAVLFGAAIGLLVGAIANLTPYFAEHWQAGPRYQYLALALGAALGVGFTVGVSWWRSDHSPETSSSEIPEVAGLSLMSAGSLALVAVSQTLPGTVGGAAVAAGAAATALTVCATTSVLPILAALAGGAAVTLGWSDLVDATGSTRVTLALAAAPAAVLALATLAATVTARSTTTTATTTATTTDPQPIRAQQVNGQVSNGSANNGHAINPAMVVRPTPLLSAEGVEFHYGPVQALFGVDLEVAEGEITAIVGANGAGKTTFLRTIAGLTTPSAGSIRLGGRDLRPFGAADRVLLGINQIAAGGAVAEDLTVADNLAMFGHTLPYREARAGARRALEVFPQFERRLNQRASSLSGGERQMLALAKSLVLRPRLLIVDELSLGLAPIVVSALIPIIRRLHAEGASVLLVEQSVTVALDLADRASCMEKGRIVYSSTSEALRADPGLLEAAYLEGISAALEHRGMLA